MLKAYKKFYEVGNNRYYTLDADNEKYIATENFIEVAPIFSFLKPRKLTQGFKLLKLTAPLTILFNLVANAEYDKKRNTLDTPDELLKYKVVKHSVVKDLIKAAYMDSVMQQKEDLKAWFDDVRIELAKEVKNPQELEVKMKKDYKEYEDALNIIEKNNALGKTISLDDSHVTEFIKLKMMKVKHLYTEKVTNLVKNKYFYELDAFGTLTIYRMITVKNVTKTIDTFIYDKKLLKELLELI